MTPGIYQGLVTGVTILLGFAFIAQIIFKRLDKIDLSIKDIKESSVTKEVCELKREVCSNKGGIT